MTWIKNMCVSSLLCDAETKLKVCCRCVRFMWFRLNVWFTIEIQMGRVAWKRGNKANMPWVHSREKTDLYVLSQTFYSFCRELVWFGHRHVVEDRKSQRPTVHDSFDDIKRGQHLACLERLASKACFSTAAITKTFKSFLHVEHIHPEASSHRRSYAYLVCDKFGIIDES